MNTHPRATSTHADPQRHGDIVMTCPEHNIPHCATCYTQPGECEYGGRVCGAKATHALMHPRETRRMCAYHATAPTFAFLRARLWRPRFVLNVTRVEGASTRDAWVLESSNGTQYASGSSPQLLRAFEHILNRALYMALDDEHHVSPLLTMYGLSRKNGELTDNGLEWLADSDPPTVEIN